MGIRGTSVKTSPAILVEDLWKSFKLPHLGGRSLKERLIRFWRRRTEVLWALKGVTFSVEPGETVAIVGKNGSGKSTLLGILSKIYRPTRGRVAVQGRMASLLELGAGFHPDLTGLENIYLNGAILGLSKREIDQSLEDIIAFSELEPFIDAPLRTYSAGMVMRLGFSIAVQTRPDILLVDEVLAVGDEAFQQKCYQKIHSFQEEERTILFVSHDLEAIRRVAPRCLWLHQGVLRADGPTPEVLNAYIAFSHQS